MRHCSNDRGGDKEGSNGRSRTKAGEHGGGWRCGKGGAETGARREEMKRIGSYCLSGFGSSSLFTRDNDEFQSSGEVFGKTPPRPGACAH